MLNGVVFDLDGVLLDTESFQWQGWVEVLRPFGVDLNKEEYISRYAGKNGTIIESELVRLYGLRVSDGPLLKQKEKLLMEWFGSRQINVMYYSKETVDFFATRNFKLGVASSGPRDETLLKVKRARLPGKFNVIVSRDDVSRGKPYPDIYVLTVERLGLKSETCLAIEDTQYGVESAKGAGLTCLAIPNEFSRGQDFSKADAVFKSLKGVVNYIYSLKKSNPGGAQAGFS